MNLYNEKMLFDADDLLSEINAACYYIQVGANQKRNTGIVENALRELGEIAADAKLSGMAKKLVTRKLEQAQQIVSFTL